MVRTFERNLDALDDLFAFAEDALQGVPEKRVDPREVKLVLEELFTNCVRHNKPARHGVRIELLPGDEELRIVVTDTGVERFDITQVAPVDAEAPLQSRREGGMGIQLVRRFCDDLRYEYEDGTSRITAIFRTRSRDVRDQQRR